jgi:hypothetical protein
VRERRSRPSRRDRLARRPEFRVARGTVVGTVVLALAAAGHALGGASLPVAAVLLVGAACVAVAIAVSDREWTLPRLLVALAVGQLVVHVALTLAHPAHAGHASAGWSPVAMLWWHAASVVATAVVLRRGEDLFWRTVAGLTSELLSGRPVLAPRIGTRVPRTPLAPAIVGAALLRHAVVRRGPPCPVSL